MPYEKTNSEYTSSSIIDGLQMLTLKNRKHNSPYENQDWFFGTISRDEAEHLLKIYGNEQGEYLIRNSERKFGNYSLSIRETHETMRHFRIEYQEQTATFLIGKRSFTTLRQLIEHYHKHPIYDANPANKLYLTKPLIIHETNSQF